ncbi:hypothetical protein ACGFNU_21635 [Spirillospora sp. NPDC048911]|uniref:hypothetical protein n=1 Tax=Spirillospora sp. NPDC048911 TaxID=3364527 RepID=UPI0037162FB5
MTIRIPARVNTALDVLARYRSFTVVALFAAVVAAMAWAELSAGVWLAYGGIAITAGCAARSPQVAALRTERDDLIRTNAGLTERLRDLERGDASATTAQIHQIPEEGTAA